MKIYSRIIKLPNNLTRYLKKLMSLFSSLLLILVVFDLSAETLGSQCVTATTCDDKDKPLWEIGAAGIAIYGPDYPGADESRTKQIIVPYIVYRGKIVRAGEGGILKAIAFKDKDIELDLSLDAAFSAKSNNNDARKGMNNLDTLLGIGPELTVNLYKDEAEKRELEIKFQLRTIFSTDFSNLHQRGYVFETQLKYEHKHLFHPDIKFTGSIGPIWGTEKIMAYFYQVNPNDVLSDRPEYNAKRGYLGSELTLAITIPIMENKGRIFFGTRLNFHQGAKNDNSPLLKDNTTVSVGLGFTYRFFESEKRTRY